MYLSQDSQHATANASNLEHNVTTEFQMFRVEVLQLKTLFFYNIGFHYWVLIAQHVRTMYLPHLQQSMI
jgi:hypothetical protein